MTFVIDVPNNCFTRPSNFLIIMNCTNATKEYNEFREMLHAT